MKKIKILKVLTIALFAMLGTTVALNAIVYESLPNQHSKNWRGFYYWLDMADYPNLLQSNMPLDVLIGYIVADSIQRAAPSYVSMYHTIHDMNVFSDTAEYIYRYWYAMNEFDPLRFNSFISRKYPEANMNQFAAHSKMRRRMYVNPKFTYVVSDYILHIYVNNTVHIDTSDTTPFERNVIGPNGRPLKDSTGKFVKDTFTIVNTSTVAYCKVLDTLKGGVFPSLRNAIFYNGEQQETESNGIIDNISLEALVPNITPDIVFSYENDWENGENGWSLGRNWIKPNREYIVFLELQGVDAVGSWDPVGSPHKVYYALWPYPHTLSRSMYPVEDGYVIDSRNALGFGTKVPVEEFKANIREKINEIKKFGE